MLLISYGMLSRTDKKINKCILAVVNNPFRYSAAYLLFAWLRLHARLASNALSIQRSECRAGVLHGDAYSSILVIINLTAHFVYILNQNINLYFNQICTLASHCCSGAEHIKSLAPEAFSPRRILFQHYTFDFMINFNKQYSTWILTPCHLAVASAKTHRAFRKTSKPVGSSAPLWGIRGS